MGYAKGWVQASPPPDRTGKSVAVIGSGPAGLAVADYLNKRGHAVTVYEREDRPGGLLMYGIPNMKLEKQVVERRIKIMQDEGVEFLTGMDVGRTGGTPAEVLAHHDAVVLCCGAKQPRDLDVPGRDAAGVYFAVDYLTSVTPQPAGFGLCGRARPLGGRQERPGHRGRRHRQRLPGHRPAAGLRRPDGPGK